MKLKLNGIILIKVIIITTLQAYTPIRRFHVVQGESGRYLGQTNAGSPYICHYYEPRQANTDLSNQCYNQNSKYSNDKLPYMYRGQSYPACPPLPEIKNGYWRCPLGVFSNTVEVYASCAAQCFSGFTSNSIKETVVRCPESLQWENFADLQCTINSDICQLWNLSFITSKPFQVIISWNVTTACQEQNFTFVMIGPRHNLTKRLQKNTTFMVVKDVDLDTTYEVFLFSQKKELATGKFRSAARVFPTKVVHVNTTAVKITWEAPVNNSSVIGFMVNITDGDNWFTLNTSDTSLVVSKLETGKNYTITVAAFNQNSISLQSEPVHIELQEKSDGVKNKNDMAATRTFSIDGLIIGLVAAVIVAIIVCFVMVRLFKRTWRPTRKSQQGSIDGVSQKDQISIEMDTMDNGVCHQRVLVRNIGEDDQVNNYQEESTCSSPLLAQQPHNISNTTLPILESPWSSLELSETDHLDPLSISLGEEASGLPLRSDFENVGESGNDLLKEVDKIAPKKWSRSGVSKKAPGSDSGQGSETGTCSTVSDGDDSPNRSSQSSQNSSQGRRSRQMNYRYSHQDSFDSGRVSEGETVKESEEPTGAVKVIAVEVQESCLTVISEKSLEQDSSVEIPVSIEIPVSVENEPDPEECSCTFSNFTSKVEARHVHDLGDLLDPHGHYGDRKSWKSFAEDVLKLNNWKIVAIQHRTKKTFEDEVLPQLVAEGKKLGHMVLHFSRDVHFRKDVLELIQKIHSGCLFCDEIFVNSLKDTFKE